MGYPVEMIGMETRLFSVIGANAIENKKDAFFNDFFQLADADCKMMGLNIREDDLGFFLHGLKDSKIHAIYLEEEYWTSVANLLQTDNAEVNYTGICDTIDIKDNSYIMSLTQGKAMIKLLQKICDIDTHTIMIIGATPSSKSLLYHLVKHKPSQIILAAEVIEDLLDMVKIIPDTIPYDIVRIQENTIDIKSDCTINFLQSEIKTKIDIDFNKDFSKIIKEIAEIKTKEWEQV